MLHIFYDLGIGYLLFDLVGGVSTNSAGWTKFGGISWAFETPIYIPGSYLWAQSNIGPCMWEPSIIKLFLPIFASLLFAITSAQFIQKLINKELNVLGRFYWRMIVMFLGLIFVPVPIEMSMVYEFTVLC